MATRVTSKERNALNRVIAVINGKGGVGKTTLTANVGGQLARDGYRVLIVDLDPSGNLGLDLGYADTDVDDRGLALNVALQEMEAGDPVKNVRPKLDVLVGGSKLHKAQAVLHAQRRPDPRIALVKVLAPIAHRYDVILIDCPPGADALQAAAIAAARWIVVPIRGDTGSRRGVEDIATRLEDVLDINEDVDLLGVALFGVDTAATRVKQVARDMVAEVMGVEDAVFTTVIRHSSTVSQQARRRGVLVHELSEQIKLQTARSVADDVLALTSEVVERLNTKEAEEEAR